MHELEQKARDFAIECHGNQMYSELPYISHLEDVRNIVASVLPESDFGIKCRIVAWLHDIIEDTETTKKNIENAFGWVIAQSVSNLTDEPGRNRKEKKLKTYYKMARLWESYQNTTKISRIVKIADRLSNVRSCVKNNDKDKLQMYKQEHGMFIIACYDQYLAVKNLMNELDDLLGHPRFMECW